MKNKKSFFVPIILIVFLSNVIFHFVNKYLPINKMNFESIEKKSPVTKQEISSTNSEMEIDASKYSNNKISIYNHINYIDEQSYNEIKIAYSKIDFLGEFKKGNLEVYDYYKEQYFKLFNGEATFSDKQTQKEFYLNEFGELKGINNFAADDLFLVFYFFDFDEDDAPELCISRTLGKGFIYVIKYDIDLHKFVLLFESDSGHMSILGSKKMYWMVPNFDFYQLDQHCKIEFKLSLFNRDYYDIKQKQYKYINLVTLPQFEDENKKFDFSEHMKAYAFNENGITYFRVTDGQWDELTKIFFKSVFELSKEGIIEVTFSYKELFDDLLTINKN